MNRKRYSLMIVITLVAVLIGGAIFNRLLFAPSAQAQQNAPGPQWEYCALTKAPTWGQTEEVSTGSAIFEIRAFK